MNMMVRCDSFVSMFISRMRIYLYFFQMPLLLKVYQGNSPPAISAVTLTPYYIPFFRYVFAAFIVLYAAGFFCFFPPNTSCAFILKSSPVVGPDIRIRPFNEVAMETARERGSWQSSHSQCFRTPRIKSWRAEDGEQHSGADGTRRRKLYFFISIPPHFRLGVAIFNER